MHRRLSWARHGLRSLLAVMITVGLLEGCRPAQRLHPADEADREAVKRIRARLELGMSSSALSEAGLAAVPVKLTIDTQVCVEPVKGSAGWRVVRDAGTLTVIKTRMIPAFHEVRHPGLSAVTLTPTIQRIAKSAPWERATCRVTIIEVGRWSVAAQLDKTGRVESVGPVDPTGAWAEREAGMRVLVLPSL